MMNVEISKIFCPFVLFTCLADHLRPDGHYLAKSNDIVNLYFIRTNIEIPFMCFLCASATCVQVFHNLPATQMPHLMIVRIPHLPVSRLSGSTLPSSILRECSLHCAHPARFPLPLLHPSNSHSFPPKIRSPTHRLVAFPSYPRRSFGPSPFTFSTFSLHIFFCLPGPIHFLPHGFHVEIDS